MIGIYKITNPEGKTYIGYSKKIENRWVSHKNAQHKANYKLKESLTKHGGDSHQFEVIEEVDISLLSRGQGDALLRKRERYWIKTLDTFNNGLNSNGGGSGCGSHTAESKCLIGEANRKPKPKDFGANRSKDFYTQEWKDKISRANKGRISPNKGKVGYNKGKIMSEEQKLKIGKSNSKPKPKDFLNYRKKQVIHLSTNTIYESIAEASRQLNLPSAGVSQCCSGKRKSIKGHKFKFT